jgi:leader peptidase (prepilin peptidase)/N-methyltransferase
MTHGMDDAAETLDLRPKPAILVGAGGALALVSAAFLPWSFAIASTVLGALMIAGADVDARTFLLPDTVTLGATVAGIMAAPLLDPTDPWLAGVSAAARALGCAAVLALLRAGYAQIRQRGCWCVAAA